MTKLSDEEIQQSLTLLEQEKNSFLKKYWEEVILLQQQCNHSNRLWEHNSYEVDYGYEHYFFSTCQICGDVIEVDENSSEFSTLMNMYWDGEIK